MGKIEVNTLVTFAWTSHTIFSSLRNAKNSILYKQSAGNLSPLYWKSENGQRGFFLPKPDHVANIASWSGISGVGYSYRKFAVGTAHETKFIPLLVKTTNSSSIILPYSDRANTYFSFSLLDNKNWKCISKSTRVRRVRNFPALRLVFSKCSLTKSEFFIFSCFCCFHESC